MAAESSSGTLTFESRVRQESTFARDIRARLTIDAARLAGNVEHIRRFLPPQNIDVTLAGYTLTRELLELMPESVARENMAVLLEGNGRELKLAMADPRDYDTIEKLTFILNKDIEPVQVSQDEIAAAIECCYGQSETESVSSIHYEAPLVGLEGDADSFTLAGIFVTAFSQQEYGRECDGFEMYRDSRGCVVVYIDGSRSIAAESHAGGVFTRLLDHLRSLPLDAEYAADDCSCLDLDIPLLSGRRFPATLSRRENDANWFRVRFRWEDRE
jgi:hypothetical protein